jgi:hypothetical protein
VRARRAGGARGPGSAPLRSVRGAAPAFGSGRNGSNFASNPLGNRYEALIEGSRIESEGDGIGYVKSRIDEQGWTAEVAIPFKTLSLDPRSGDWGFRFVREVRRKNEKQRLMHGTRSRRNFDLADASILPICARMPRSSSARSNGPTASGRGECAAHGTTRA